jgi:hypothetical protein
MKKLFLLIFIWGCGEPYYPLIENEKDEEEELSSITFELDNEVDENGFVHITTNPNVFQTLYRLYGHLYRDDKPMNVIKFVWGSETYWLYDGFDVPIVNGSSYSNEDGEVNTMMGVLHSMVGDTVIVFYGYFDNWREEETYGEIYVVIH